MAGKKKQEIALQKEIETQEEWEECMAMEGIWVVDVYQEWCGPCHALVGNFRRLKNELGDTLLNYAIAKADTIDALDKYRGRCEPTFLFYAGGILVSYIHGANAPKIQRTITEQLAQEHKVLEGQAERKEVKDNVMTRAAEKEIAQQEAEQLERELEALKYEWTPKGITVAILKPDVVAQGKTEEIIQEIKDQGIEILASEERTLTDDEAMELYKDLEDEPFFNDLIKFVTSGPCNVLVLTKGQTGQSIVNDWREIIGPTNVESAKTEAPNSLRAKYGESGYINALHGSSSSESAARELAFFFPQLGVPTYKKKKENIQRTLAIIRPEAFTEKKEEILEKISEAGFKIALYKEIVLTNEQASEFYKEHEGQSYFDQLIESMTSGPVLALCLAGDEAIGGWRDMLGPPNLDEAVENAPHTLRAQFKGESGVNQFHGSDSEEKAKKEIGFFFPMEETVAVIKPSAMGTKDAIVDRIHEAGFRIAARKETNITRDIAEILYPKQSDKEYYDDLIENMISGPTMFMVLTREDAVHGWRDVIGETDPEEAKEKNPTSIRAQFGMDILNNAVHGSSDQEQAKREVKAIFGDLEFNDDGTVKGQEPELDDPKKMIEVERASPVAETAPEYKDTEGDTTVDETTAETTQDTTADTTQDVTANETQQGDDTKADETTAADTTTAGDETTAADETTAGDSTIAEESEVETTQGETTVGDTTVEATVDGDETQGDVTQADETQADETQAAETTAGDTTAGDTTTEEPTATDPTTTDPEASTVAETTTASEAKGETQETKEEKKDDEPKQEEHKDESPSEAKGEEIEPTKPAAKGEETEPTKPAAKGEEEEPTKPAAKGEEKESTEPAAKGDSTEEENTQEEAKTSEEAEAKGGSSEEANEGETKTTSDNDAAQAKGEADGTTTATE